MAEDMGGFIDNESVNFKLSIKEAVQDAMGTINEIRDIISDLKICLIRNKTLTPFVTSDDPAILTNRWYLQEKRTRGSSFGLNAAGNILLLPLSPNVLCLGYDANVYSVPHKKGWVDVKHDVDIKAFNQHQLLNCRANIFVHEPAYEQSVCDEFKRIMSFRPKSKHTINYLIPVSNDQGNSRYRVVDKKIASTHKKTLMHTEVIHSHPDIWPKQLLWRPKGVVFTNDTAIGYIRKSSIPIEIQKIFRKELARISS